MNNEVNKYTVLLSLFWKLMERVGTQGIQFVIQIILARLLLPSDYGILSLIAIFIVIANVFVQSGLNTALIQKKRVDDIDFSSVFYLSLFIAGLLYIILFLTAPMIAGFYDEPKLIPVIRVLAITLFLGAFNSIQNAVISKRMEFKKLFFSSLGAALVSGIAGIASAYRGLGVWALVTQQLINQFISCIILLFIVNWRPKMVFSFDRLKVLFLYGWKLLISSLIDTIYINLQSLVIGRIYNPAMLGYYSRGDQFPQIIVSNINGSIQSVMLPTLAAEQDNRQRVKDMVRRSIVTSSLIILPIMFGLAMVAEPLVRILLSDKWVPCVPFMQIACMYYALYPINTSNLQAINALGRSDIFLKLEVIKKLIGLPILAISIFHGIYAIAVGMLFNGVISTFINAYPNLILLNYSIKEQCKDIMPSLLISLIMAALVHNFKYLHMSSWLTLIIQVCVGGVVYIGMARLFNLECYKYLISTFKEIFKNRKGAVI